MDFNQEVLEKSKDRPVVVDFWAPWCGPCKFLGPVIEELATQAAGKWELVKVNTDENQEVSRNYRIQGIPAVKMFHEGEIIAEFTGALPKHQIHRWLEQHLPDKRKNELSRILLNTGSTESPKTQELEKFVENNPDFEEGVVALARLITLKDPDKAARLVKNIKPGNPHFSLIEDVLAIESLTKCTIESDGNLAHKLTDVKEGIKGGDIESAIEGLIEAVMIDKNYCDELPRKSVIALFNLLGNDHPLTKKYRKRFDMALY